MFLAWFRDSKSSESTFIEKNRIVFYDQARVNGGRTPGNAGFSSQASTNMIYNFYVISFILSRI